jgi:6-pyruvoyl tetrahydropterin synthase
MRQHGHGNMAGAVIDQGHNGGAADVVRILRPAEQFVRGRLHRQALNEVLDGLNPTAELLARLLYIHLTDQLGIGGITRVLVAETPGTLAEYRP